MASAKINYPSQKPVNDLYPSDYAAERKARYQHWGSHPIYTWMNQLAKDDRTNPTRSASAVPHPCHFSKLDSETAASNSWRSDLDQFRQEFPNERAQVGCFYDDIRADDLAKLESGYFNLSM
jgi:hypothetical protein